jgi:membrane protease YdiL (CAAX protease family)
MRGDARAMSHSFWSSGASRGWKRGVFLDATGARLAVLLIAAAAAWLVRDNPLETASWLGLTGVASSALSLAGGALVAVIFVYCTRIWAVRSARGRDLARDLAVKASDMRTRQIFFVAAAASVTEELFFRGALVPTLGIVVAAVAFGALHLRSGVAWSVLAALFGAALGTVFCASGSLAGPVVAHFAVDAIALFSAREASLEIVQNAAPVRRLGGLLGDTTRAPH